MEQLERAYRQARRRAARALQFLFSLDFTGATTGNNWKTSGRQRLSPVRGNTPKKLIHGSAAAVRTDDEISGALDRWTPDRIGYIERSALGSRLRDAALPRRAGGGGD